MYETSGALIHAISSGTCPFCLLLALTQIRIIQVIQVIHQF